MEHQSSKSSTDSDTDRPPQPRQPKQRWKSWSGTDRRQGAWEIYPQNIFFELLMANYG